MNRFLTSIAALAIIAVGIGWVITAPQGLSKDMEASLDESPADAENGELVFWAAGCASCHAASDAEGDDKLLLTGGQEFVTEFGTFVAPNISPDPLDGIGGWTVEDLALALTKGETPDGTHLYPAFPYTAYTHMLGQDIADLKAFMDGLPHTDSPSKASTVSFPFNIRRGLGLWKALYLDPSWAIEDADDPVLSRGRYLVEALGHCAECHTPRDGFGGLDRSRWMGGAPNPDGKGTIPNITPGGLDWSAEDIAYYLETGFTPDFDSAGGQMADVVDNFSRLPAEDRAAVAAYLKAIPAVD